MKLYRLIVKGDANVAVDSARERGFEVEDVLAESSESTTLLAQTEQADAAMLWFREHFDPPFPLGELLWYLEVGEIVPVDNNWKPPPVDDEYREKRSIETVQLRGEDKP